VGGEIFRTLPDGPRDPPSLLYNGYRVFPGGKSAGAWSWPPTPSSAEVKRRAELYISPSRLLWPVLGWTLSLLWCPTEGLESEGHSEYLPSCTSVQGGTLLTCVREVLGWNLEHDTYCPECFFVSLGLAWQMTHECFFHIVCSSSTGIVLFDAVPLLWSYCITRVTRLTACKVTNYESASI